MNLGLVGVPRLSRIGLRLLAFNLLVVFVPVTSMLYLDVYETRLREAQETSLFQQARVLAASLADRPSLDPEAPSRLFERLERRSDARLRVYDRDGALIADSARQAAGTALDDVAKYPVSGDGKTRQRRLYRIGAWLASLRKRIASLVPATGASGTSPSDADLANVPPEVRVALAGRYGAATRATPGQRSVTMFSAVPVRHQGDIIGVVVASQSTFRILTALYAIRLRLFEIVLASLVVAALLTALAATTIVRPLTRLRRQAAALAERRGPLPEAFTGAQRLDEIGALARSLGELSRRTNDHIDLLQSFSADISHELKNPLASIRTAAEMMADAESADERRRFLDLMVRDVARLECLVSGLRDVARVEGQIEADVSEPLALDSLLGELVAAASAAVPSEVRVVLAIDAPGVHVVGSRDRLAQVFENLLANAASFAPPGSTVGVSLRRHGRNALVTVDDEGPGIPPSHLDRVFARFFSYRPKESRREHVGLGLAIARQITESYGGTIEASNRPERGARLTVTLPIHV